MQRCLTQRLLHTKSASQAFKGRHIIVHNATRLPVAFRRGPARSLITAAAAAADAAPPAEKRRGRKAGPRQKKEVPEEAEMAEQGMPDLPQPLDYQQTLIKSFTIGGVGLHSGEYAVVRVRPAFAGEGRYFVRVPEGTNKNRFAFDDGDMSDIPYDQAIQPEAVSEEIEDQKVEWFQLYLVCQEEEGFIGTFPEWLQEQVEDGALTEELRNALLDIKPEPGDFEPSVEPDFSDEPEDIEAMDPEDESLVAASIACVVEAGLPFTRLGVGDTRVEGAELLLAALEASGVDNARIEVEGGHEIPVLDNSALPWCIEVQVAGLRPAPVNLDKGAGEPAPDAAADDEDEDNLVVQKDMFTPSKAVGVQDDMGWISFFPGPFTRLTCGVDHTMLAPIIGSQWYTWRAEETYFRYNVAPARAYVESVDELFAMRNAGYVKAGAENLFLIAAGDRWWDPSMVRMVYDEPARFKVSQLLGNLSLMAVAGSQGLPVGHITAYNASPTLQLTFVQQLMQAIEEADVTSLNDVASKQEDWVQEKYVSSTRTSTSVGPEGLPAQQDAEIAEEGEEEQEDEDEDEE